MTAIIAWGIWNVQTDDFPFMQHVRPDFYLYGWPICFATSGRGRFNFYQGFEVGYLFFDLAVSLLLVAYTALAVESRLRQLPRISLIDLVATGAAVGTAFFILSDGLNGPLKGMFDAVPPAIHYAAVPGEVRPVSRLDAPDGHVLALAFAAMAFAVVKRMFVHWDTAKRKQPITTGAHAPSPSE